MISIVQPVFAGNALRLFIEPPAAAAEWKVLRKGSNTFSGHDDASALLAYQGNERVVVDTEALQNDVMQFYCPFYTSDGGATWVAGPVANGTPRATYDDLTPDVLAFFRERLEAGLLVEVQRGNIVNDIGYVQVYTAPPSLERDLRFPLVTIHVENDEATDRFVGEDLAGDWMDSVGDDGSFSEGWLTQTGLVVIGWSLNPDERQELRRAIRRIIVANLPVFSSKGIEQINLSQQDVDSINGEYPSPIYQVMNTISCLAPVRVGGVDRYTQTIQQVDTRSSDAQSN
jgi:hypothetical protein